VKGSLLGLAFLNGFYVIALSSADRSGKARAERAHQESEKEPQQQMRCRLAGHILRLPGIRDDIRNPFFGFGLTDAGPGPLFSPWSLAE
jgi:hypothetical protein